MPFTFSGDADCFVIAFETPHSARRFGGLAYGLLLAALVLVLGWLFPHETRVIFVEAVLFALAIVYFALRRTFGEAQLTIRTDSITLDRKVLGINRRQTFPRSDVENIGYGKEVNGYESHQDSGLSIMLRTHIVPLLFARTITDDEAKEALARIEQSGSWIGKHIRPFGTGTW